MPLLKNQPRLDDSIETDLRYRNYTQHNTFVNLKEYHTRGNAQVFNITLPLNIARLQVTLVWNDTVATAFSPNALVNDIDLKLMSESLSQAWYPWVLSTFPNKDSLTALPVRKRDNINNAEEITIDNPLPGNYQIEVFGYNIPSGAQKYYVAYSYDTLNQFQWNHPTGADFLEAAKEGILRWETNFAGASDIEYSFPSSNTWLPITHITDFSKNYFKWIVPDTIALCLLRMKIGTSYFYSDTFLITSLLNPKVGFVCNDTVLLYWNKLRIVNAYEVYELGEKYMEPLIQVSDTSVLLPVEKLTSKYFSVAPILTNGFVGAKSYAFNYSLQGTGCYIRNFLAELDSNAARLALSLGTTFKVRSVAFEKLTSSGFASIYSSPVNNQIDFSSMFQELTKGINVFRAKITLENGEVIYSENGSVYYVERGSYLVFPVPVNRGNNLEIFTTLPEEETLQLFDILGRTVLKKQLI